MAGCSDDELPWDREGDFVSRCNLGTVVLEKVAAESDIDELFELIELHQDHTGSVVAQKIIDQWPESIGQFVKVMPIDYKRVLLERAKQEEKSVSELHEEVSSK